MASCTYADGNSLTVRYSDANPGKKHELQNGKVWSPGDVPMLLFTETPVTFAGCERRWCVQHVRNPRQGKWTLIVNKNVAAGATYDEKQDLARTPMQTGQFPARSISRMFHLAISRRRFAACAWTLRKPAHGQMRSSEVTPVFSLFVPTILYSDVPWKLCASRSCWRLICRRQERFRHEIPHLLKNN